MLGFDKIDLTIDPVCLSQMFYTLLYADLRPNVDPSKSKLEVRLLTHQFITAANGQH